MNVLHHTLMSANCVCVVMNVLTQPCACACPRRCRPLCGLSTSWLAWARVDVFAVYSSNVNVTYWMWISFLANVVYVRLPSNTTYNEITGEHSQIIVIGVEMIRETFIWKHVNVSDNYDLYFHHFPTTLEYNIRILSPLGSTTKCHTCEQVGQC